MERRARRGPAEGEGSGTSAVAENGVRQMEDRIAVDVETAAEMLGISRASLYPLVMAGDIPSFKVGRRRLVPVGRLRDWAASRSDNGQWPSHSGPRSTTETA